MTRSLSRASFGIALLAVSYNASAHPGHDTTALDGWLHPFTGYDHWLAMLAVGAWAVMRHDGKRTWAIPAMFVTCVALGTVSGLISGAHIAAEWTIQATLIGLGALMVTATRLPFGAALALIGLAGFAHGHAHGSEMSSTALWGAFGFCVSTAVLHAAGAGAAMGLRRIGHESSLRWMGAGVSIAGLAAMFG